MQRAFVSILCEDVERSKAFYIDVLDMKVLGDFGWFVVMSNDAMPGWEFGLLDQTHETVPEPFRCAPQGAIFTFVIDDADAAYRRAKKLGIQIVESPRDMPYGQRRVLLKDPAGALVDISSPIASTAD